MGGFSKSSPFPEQQIMPRKKNNILEHTLGEIQRMSLVEGFEPSTLTSGVWGFYYWKPKTNNNKRVEFGEVWSDLGTAWLRCGPRNVTTAPADFIQRNWIDIWLPGRYPDSIDGYDVLFVIHAPQSWHCSWGAWKCYRFSRRTNQGWSSSTKWCRWICYRHDQYD